MSEVSAIPADGTSLLLGSRLAFFWTGAADPNLVSKTPTALPCDGGEVTVFHRCATRIQL